MRAKRIGPDRASIAVDEQMGIVLRNAKRLLCGNRHAALGCAGGPADKLLSRALLLPSGRRRRARGQSERECGEETRHARNHNRFARPTLPIPLRKRSVAKMPHAPKHHQNLLKIREFREEVASGDAVRVVMAFKFAAAVDSGATGVRFMRIRALAVIVVLAVSAALFVELRKDNRADAAASNCYSDAQGPSAPTLCN